MNILLIDDNQNRAQAIQQALKGSQYSITHLVSAGSSLLREVDIAKPDMIVIDIESPDRDILESLHTLNQINPKPIVMFTETQDSQIIKRSIKSGVSAYVTGDADPNRVRAILDAAVARFEEFQDLKSELKSTQNQLGARKTIEKAKRMLIEKQGLDEDAAYKAMRKMAMDSGQKLEQVATNIMNMLKNLP
ncbi:ANTAR domain-containing response regulator [Glaciecola petra]|uniref:ANTAR domain-containing protein n=1 Tax=Glaciecola petra TaxID=3075602 RepID=A0ABU2ZSV0_9ALTE|nr:ANTAR domain-containing protein [Aestuariibacter sp. P117]MDT0595708.1 ANTAR domain-containing protein [Aestuariibacter sp. P117]